MFDSKFIDDLTERFTKLIPPEVAKFQKELQQDFRSVLQSTFAKLDLVTREEFDVQAKVLAQTRKKLTLLEKELHALEEKLKHSK